MVVMVIYALACLLLLSLSEGLPNSKPSDTEADVGSIREKDSGDYTAADHLFLPTLSAGAEGAAGESMPEGVVREGVSGGVVREGGEEMERRSRRGNMKQGKYLFYSIAIML